MPEKRNSIKDVAHALGRVPHTLRVWENDGRLPKALIPKRDERNWRYWTDEQVKALKQWVIDEDMRPGKGLRAAQARKAKKS